MMNKTLTILSIAVTFVSCGSKTQSIIDEELAKGFIVEQVIDTAELEYRKKITKLADAFAKVESNHNAGAISADGKYYGCLQIGQQMLDNFERKFGVKYELRDCLSKQTSYYIFSEIMMRRNQDLDVDKACRIWNPRAGDWYKKRIENALREQND